jgi:hypothetical protein
MHSVKRISDRTSLGQVYNTAPPDIIVSGRITETSNVHLPWHNHEGERPIREDLQDWNKAVLFQDFSPPREQKLENTAFFRISHNEFDSNMM